MVKETPALVIVPCSRQKTKNTSRSSYLLEQVYCISGLCVLCRSWNTRCLTNNCYDPARTGSEHQLVSHPAALATQQPCRLGCLVGSPALSTRLPCRLACPVDSPALSTRLPWQLACPVPSHTFISELLYKAW
jgi:hypothetical protein